MKEFLIFAVLAGLVIFGGMFVAAALDSMAASWAVASQNNALRDIAVTQIHANTTIQLKQLDMIEAANLRSFFAIMFFPALGVSAILMFFVMRSKG